MVAGRPIVINGNDYLTDDGTPLRDFIDIRDLALIHTKLVEIILCRDIAEVINLGTGEARSVQNVIENFEEILGRKIEVTIAPRRPGDIEFSCASNLKLMKLIPDLSFINFKETIKSVCSAHSLI